MEYHARLWNDLPFYIVHAHKCHICGSSTLTPGWFIEQYPVVYPSMIVGAMDGIYDILACHLNDAFVDAWLWAAIASAFRHDHRRSPLTSAYDIALADRQIPFSLAVPS